jgi:hypothetical protein
MAVVDFPAPGAALTTTFLPPSTCATMAACSGEAWGRGMLSQIPALTERKKMVKHTTTKKTKRLTGVCFHNPRCFFLFFILLAGPDLMHVVLGGYLPSIVAFFLLFLAQSLERVTPLTQVIKHSRASYSPPHHVAKKFVQCFVLPLCWKLFARVTNSSKRSPHMVSSPQNFIVSMDISLLP